ncbi:MAG TPA: sensor domain-containing protein [Streptosporangiales bacterium]
MSTADPPAEGTAAEGRRRWNGRFALLGLGLLLVPLCVVSGVVSGVVFGVSLAFGLLLVCLPMVPLSVLLILPWTRRPAKRALRVLVTVYGPILVAMSWLARGFANLHRFTVGGLLGERVPRPYLTPRRPTWWSRSGRVLRDAATWRDLCWLLVSTVVGSVLCVLPVVLLAGALWYLAFPLVGQNLAGYSDLPDLLADVSGVGNASVIGLAMGVVLALLWWAFTPSILRSHARVGRSMLGPTQRARLALRVAQLAASRAETVDSQAAEIRRIERDLHDGAQARLVALGMNLGMAEQLLEADPDTARELIAEARQSSSAALAELRGLVRGIHPPVLADRGLDGAVRALALDSPLSVHVDIGLSGRPPAPVESAAYFAVAETLTNVAKHGGTVEAWVRIEHSDGVLRLTVIDHGRGGAGIGAGGGLHGVQRRLAAFDGTLALTSPAGGPTVVRMEVPCALAGIPGVAE